LEAQIAETETLLAQRAEQLQTESEAQRVDEVRRLAADYTATQARLDELLNQWVTLGAE
jgi:hypothetical protein